VPLYAFRCGSAVPLRCVRQRPGWVSPKLSDLWRTGKAGLHPPGVRLVPTPIRTARDLEEKSAPEPAVVGQRTGRPLPRQRAPTPPWVLGH
jgi:hypothetical protein